MASVGERPTARSSSPAYVKLKAHHKEAFSLLSRALEIEEQGGKSLLILNLYIPREVTVLVALSKDRRNYRFF